MKKIILCLSVMTGLILLTGCASKEVRVERQDAANLCASVKGLKRVTYSHFVTKKHKVYFAWYGRLPDMKTSTADVVLDFTDGSKIEIDGRDMYSGTHVSEDANSYSSYIFDEFKAISNKQFYPEGDMVTFTIKGKEIPFYPETDADDKLFVDWMLAHKGKTLGTVKVATSDGGSSQVKLSKSQLRQYQKWEKANRDQWDDKADEKWLDGAD